MLCILLIDRYVELIKLCTSIYYWINNRNNYVKYSHTNRCAIKISYLREYQWFYAKTGVFKRQHLFSRQLRILASNDNYLLIRLLTCIVSGTLRGIRYPAHESLVLIQMIFPIYCFVWIKYIIVKLVTVFVIRKFRIVHGDAWQ